MLLSLLEYIEVSSLLSVDDINVGFITIFISFSPDFFDDALVSCTCGLIFSRYFSSILSMMIFLSLTIWLQHIYPDSRIWLISQPYQWCQLFSDIGLLLAIYIFPSSSRSIGRGCGLSLSLRLWVDGDLIAILGLVQYVVSVQFLALILEWALVRILEAL